MENMTYTGVITDITIPQPFSAKDGTTHTEKYIIVQTEERFPQTAALRVVDQNAMREYHIGDRVRCSIEFRASQGQTGRWFNTIKAWKVEPITSNM